MNVKFKYVLLCLNLMLMDFGTNGNVISKSTDDVTPRDARFKRQAGYVYDKPSVSFDLPTATSIATTQAPTVDRIQMQMYYAYPVPASRDSANVAQQNTGASAGSTAVSSSSNGYNYGVQNTGTSASSTAVSSSANGYNYGVQNSQITESRSVTETQNTANTGYQNADVTATQAVVSSGSTGYGDGRPTAGSVSTSGGVVSTSAPKYLPPQTSGGNTVTVTTNNQAQTGVTNTKPSDSYIPPSVQVSSPQNDQTVTVTQTAANVPSSPANPNTSYLLPNPQPAQPAPNASPQPGPVQTAPNVPTQQYLPPIESQGGQRTIQGTVAAPASTYLPPVF